MATERGLLEHPGAPRWAELPLEQQVMPSKVETQRLAGEPSDLEKFFETINAEPAELTRFTPADIVDVIDEDREEH